MNVVCCRIEHLGLNVVLQLLVGVPLEMVHGATRIGLVYVTGVVAGMKMGLVFKVDWGRPCEWDKPQASRSHIGSYHQSLGESPNSWEAGRGLLP
jgi:hypothetical protein